MQHTTVGDRVAAGATAAADFVYGTGHDAAPALDQGPADTATSDSSAARLKSFIERVERLEEEKAGIVADIKEVFAEAKGTGFDVKIMRAIIRLRKLEAADRAEQQELLDLYQRALGMVV